MRWLWSAVAGVLIGFSVFAVGAVGTASAEPAQPGPTTPSTSDELADMVMDIIEHDAPAVPTTTPAPAPAP
jgi:hypothetical protein